MNIVISNPKTGKAHSTKVETPGIFAGKKIGNTTKLDTIGLTGYEGTITGGSDKDGFPMKHDLQGTARKKIFVTTNKKKGTRKRTTKRGNQITSEIHQINIKITKEGPKPIEEIMPKKEEKKTDEK
jgi:small subunit ribosomal protein S6e